VVSVRFLRRDVRYVGGPSLSQHGGPGSCGAGRVFLLLPVTVVFALFPGLISIVSLAQ
jgi:hypothetical protein